MPIKSSEDLAAEIRRRRRGLELTQRQAADMSGVSLALWNDFERGHRENVGFGALLRMIQTLGLDLEVTPRHRGGPGTR